MENNNTEIQEFNNENSIVEELIENIDDFISNSQSPLTESEQEILDNVIAETFANSTTENTVISENSSTLKIDESVSRFSSAVWFDKTTNKNVMIAGCGGVGSWLSLLIARVKPNMLYLYDPDIVEFANMSGQLYNINTVKVPKVNAINRIISDFSSFRRIYAYYKEYTESSEACNIMLCGFDNMEARKIYFNNWKKHITQKPEEERKKCLYIDGRLNAEEFQILCIRGDDSFNIARYENEFLFSDSEVEEAVCSYKQTSFCASMIASYITNLFVNFCAQETGVYRELPFFISYNAEIMYLKTES